MKICVTSTGQSLDDSMDPRFGRCLYFIIWNTDTSQFEAIQNPAISAGGGAGIKAAQLIADKGVETVVTGNIGPNAYDTLTAADIKIVVGIAGITVRQAIDGFKTGKHEYVTGPSVNAHYGGGGSSSSPRGMGPLPDMGRGMGGGRGRGRGCGPGKGRGMRSGSAPQQSPLARNKGFNPSSNNLKG